MRWLFTLILSAFVSVVAQAQSSPNNVLAQLGVNGVTDKIYGTNVALYANYLIKTGTNGLIDVSLIPLSLRVYSWNKTAFIDSVNGADTTNAGTASYPYKTFVYAANRATNDTIFMFTPGAYTAGTITNANVYHVALVGLDATNTVMSGTLAFNASLMAGTQDISADLYGITIDVIRQQQYGLFNVSLYNRAKVNNVTRQYTTANSSLVTFVDPSSYLAAVPGGANATLYVKAYVPQGTTLGELTYWNGTNWMLVTAGTTNQVLLGGIAPAWGNISALVPIYAMNAGFVTNSGFATNAGWAAFATNSGWAAFATNSSYALFATNSGWAAYSTNSGFATNAGYAFFATNANWATNAGHALTADIGYTTNAFAYFATNADFATNAGWAAFATNAGFATNETLATVTARGSNTAENLWLEGSHTTIGARGTEAWAGAVYGLNLGDNENIRTNVGQGNINGGYNSGVEAVQSFDNAAGGLNLGYLKGSAVQLQNMYSTGCMNMGMLNGGQQWMLTSDGCFNLGAVASSIQAMYGAGSINFGVLYAYSLQTNWGLGSINGGYLNTATQYLGGYGALNYGYLTSGQIQTNASNGSVILGGPGTSTHDYAILLGSGQTSTDTNAVFARKYYERGLPLPSIYAALDSNNYYTVNTTNDFDWLLANNLVANTASVGNVAFATGTVTKTAIDNNDIVNWFTLTNYLDTTALLGETLDVVCQRGSNTTANLSLQGTWNSIGVTVGTEVWGASGIGNLNLGYNNGTRIMQSSVPMYGSINAGCIGSSDGVQAMYKCAGSMNFGDLWGTGSVQTQNLCMGAFNLGELSFGLQMLDSGEGSFNLGYVLRATQLVSTVSGVTYTGIGDMNAGALLDGARQINTGSGSFNFGFLTNGVVQTNGGKGSFILGGAGVNTHDYSLLLGDGLTSQETNSVNARKYFENGTSLDAKYALISLETLAAVTARGSNTTENLHLNGLHNTLGAYVNEDWGGSTGSVNMGYAEINTYRTNAANGGLNAGWLGDKLVGAHPPYQILGTNAFGSVNMGVVGSGYGQENYRLGCLNFGALHNGHQIHDDGGAYTYAYDGGNLNIGSLYSGTQRSGPDALGCLNIGYVQSGCQDVTGQGSENHGWINGGTGAAQTNAGVGSYNYGSLGGGQQIIDSSVYNGENHGDFFFSSITHYPRQIIVGTSRGVYNYGSLQAYKSGTDYSATTQSIDTASGVMNLGCLAADLSAALPGGWQAIVGSKGSMQIGNLAAGEYEYMSGSGCLSVGVNITNSHNNATVFGSGLNSSETNSVLARKYFVTQSIVPTGSNTADIGSQTMPFRQINASNFNAVGSSYSINGIPVIGYSNNAPVIYGTVTDSNGMTFAVLPDVTNVVTAYAYQTAPNVTSIVNNMTGGVEQASHASATYVPLAGGTLGIGAILDANGGTYTNAASVTTTNLSVRGGSINFGGGAITNISGFWIGGVYVSDIDTQSVVNAQGTIDSCSNRVTSLEGSTNKYPTFAQTTNLVSGMTGGVEQASHAAVTYAPMVQSASVTFCPTNITPWILSLQGPRSYAITITNLYAYGYNGTSVWYLVVTTNNASANTWTTNGGILAANGSWNISNNVAISVAANAGWGWVGEGAIYDPASSNANISWEWYKP